MFKEMGLILEISQNGSYLIVREADLKKEGSYEGGKEFELTSDIISQAS